MKLDFHLVFYVFIFTFQMVIAQQDETSESAETSSDYLQSVISQLQKDIHNQHLHLSALDRNEHTEDLEMSTTSAPQVTSMLPKIMGPTPIPHMNASGFMVHTQERPKISVDSLEMSIQPPPLSNEELVALYRAALMKGATLKWENAVQGVQLNRNPEMEPSQDPLGYYYYFYPIKKLKSAPIRPQEAASDGSSKIHSTTIQPGADMMTSGTKLENTKVIEPLFMAMTGFISMAIMFATSVLFLPKWTKWNIGGDRGSRVQDQLASITSLVMDALDGQDCSERLTCEFGRMARTLKFSDRPIRILEILAPGVMRSQLQAVRRYAWRKTNCTIIACNPATGENITSQEVLIQNNSNIIRKKIFTNSNNSTNRKPISTRIYPIIKITPLSREEKDKTKYNISKYLQKPLILQNSNTCSNIHNCNFKIK